jgi:pyruvate/2-oxoglutarate dehydrogenase complex dihydrolipoamide dehydrogenase (E3) component
VTFVASRGVARRYDAIVIGAGQAGVPLARDLAAAGRRVALVERAHVGGTCYNEGCTPTKTMIASARVAYLARRAADFGVTTGPVEVDLATVRQRKRDIVAEWRTGMEKRLRDTPGLDLIWGEARFESPTTVAVAPVPAAGGRAACNGVAASGVGAPVEATSAWAGHEELRLEAEQIFINTGDRPATPDIPGLARMPFLGSTEIMELDVVPRHLVVLGAGYVALEFGQMFRRFGSEVTIVQRSGHVLSREDDDVADALAAILREDGIVVLLDTPVAGVERSGDGGVAVLVGGAQPRRIEGSHLLVATGRQPNTEGLDLPAAGVRTDERGYILVNDRLETSAPGIWALGDVKGGPAFTHISYDDYRVVRGNLLRGGGFTTSGRLVPYTVFTDPQLGRVGLSETEARKLDLDIQVKMLKMDWVARALETAESRGFMKAVVDRATGRILGAAVLGVDGGELLAQIQIAMMGGITAAQLHDAVFAHPTLAESLNNLFA